jgi:predicted TIM-barrel fold metal-dependent hydrolase
MINRRELLRRLGIAGVSVSALGGIVRAAMPTNGTAPSFEVLPGSCDCHVHVFDTAKFPFVEKRTYTPPDATADELVQLQRSLRLDRVVVVQPSVYGADNSCTLDAMRRLGDRARGVAVIDRATSHGEIDDMAAAGVRGIRLNLHTNASGKFDADGAKAMLDAAAQQIAGRGWHVQFYTGLNIIAELKDHVLQLPFPVVFDHFGRAAAEKGPGQAGFDTLLELVKSGHTYVKISGAYRISKKAPDYVDVMPLAQALVAANPDRIVWGTDWPHPNSDAGRGKPLSEISAPFAIDDGLLFNQLASWIPDVATRKKILVDNPARLYGFDNRAS